MVHSGAHSDDVSPSDWVDEPKPIAEVKRPSRPKPSRRLSRAEDFLRFDRPDMFTRHLFDYAGLLLAPDPSKKPHILPAFRLPHPRCRLLRLSVDPGVIATGAELFSALQDTLLSSPDGPGTQLMPGTLSLGEQELSVEYAPPHGDELYFGAHSQDAAWIGPNLLGTVMIEPEGSSQTPDADVASASHAWEAERSFPSWHKATLPGCARSLDNTAQHRSLDDSAQNRPSTSSPDNDEGGPTNEGGLDRRRLHKKRRAGV